MERSHFVFRFNSLCKRETSPKVDEKFQSGSYNSPKWYKGGEMWPEAYMRGELRRRKRNIFGKEVGRLLPHKLQPRNQGDVYNIKEIQSGKSVLTWEIIQKSK